MLGELTELVKSNKPVPRTTLEYWTEMYMKHEEQMTFEESDQVDALLRILEDRVNG